MSEIEKSNSTQECFTFSIFPPNGKVLDSSQQILTAESVIFTFPQSHNNSDSYHLSQPNQVQQNQLLKNTSVSTVCESQECCVSQDFSQDLFDSVDQKIQDQSLQ